MKIVSVLDFLPPMLDKFKICFVIFDVASTSKSFRLLRTYSMLVDLRSHWISMVFALRLIFIVMGLDGLDFVVI